MSRSSRNPTICICENKAKTSIITIKRVQLIQGKAEITEDKGVKGGHLSKLPDVKRVQSAVWVCNRHKIARNFHTSVVFCDEVKVVSCPPFAESITEGDIRWEKAVGDAVAVDEVIGEIETDKVSVYRTIGPLVIRLIPVPMVIEELLVEDIAQLCNIRDTSIPVPSTAAGVIEELLVEDGSTVEAGAQLCKIRVGGEASAQPKATPAAPAPEPVKEAAPPPPAAKPTPPPPQTPSAGPIPTTMPPVPPVPTAPISSTQAASVKPIAAVPPTMAGEVSSAGARTETRVKMNRMRQRIAQRLKDAQNTCAMLTTFNEVDMSNIMQMRSQYKDSFEKKHGIRLSFMSAFIKASAYALQEQPIVNAVIEDLDIVYRDYIDISVAVSTPKGLVVPVIRNVENMNYKDIEAAVNSLGEKARAGNLAIEDMDGGTFSISNGGVFGSMFGTPIINPPQSAILGMHAIFDRPVAIKGQIEIRPMMYVALTYDHRLIDGRDAVTFLKKIKSAVEDPRVLLLNL